MRKHWGAWSRARCCINRTVRARTAGENRVRPSMTPYSHHMASRRISARFNAVKLATLLRGQFATTESAVSALLRHNGPHCSIRLVSSERRVRHCTPLFVVVRSQTPCVPICSSFGNLCRAKRGSSRASDSSRPRMPPTFASMGWLALCAQRSGGLDHLSMIRSQAGWRLRFGATHEDFFHRGNDYSIARWMCSR